VPYRFGAFSFTSYADCRKLVERGLLTDEDKRWRLTEDGVRRARERQYDRANTLDIAASRVPCGNILY